MKKRALFLFFIVPFMTIACGEETPSTPTPSGSKSPYWKFLELGAKNGFEIEFKDNVKFASYETINYSYKNDMLSIVHKYHSLGNNEYEETLSEYSKFLSDNATYQMIPSNTLEKYKDNGWINYKIEVYKTNSTEWGIASFEFEIINKELCPILEAPDKSDCQIENYSLLHQKPVFSVNCKIDCAKYFRRFNKAETLADYIDDCENSNDNNIVEGFFSYMIRQGKYVLDKIESYPNQYPDIEIDIADSVYLEREAIEYSIAYSSMHNEENYTINATIILDKETEVTMYYKSMNLTTDESSVIVDLVKFSIGS